MRLSWQQQLTYSGCAAHGAYCSAFTFASQGISLRLGPGNEKGLPSSWRRTLLGSKHHLLAGCSESVNHLPKAQHLELGMLLQLSSIDTLIAPSSMALAWHNPQPSKHALACWAAWQPQPHCRAAQAAQQTYNSMSKHGWPLCQGSISCKRLCPWRFGSACQGPFGSLLGLPSAGLSCGMPVVPALGGCSCFPLAGISGLCTHPISAAHCLRFHQPFAAFLLGGPGISCVLSMPHLTNE